jgi:hypothetical protein
MDLIMGVINWIIQKSYAINNFTKGTAAAIQQFQCRKSGL